MKGFVILRRVLWGAILAGSIAIGCLYLSISSVFLTTSGLQKIASDSNLSQAIRNDVLLPDILESTKNSQYASILDTPTVTKAFNNAIPPDVLNNKLTPALEATRDWLDSKQPAITYSINTADLSDKFAGTLARAVSAKILSVPECTVSNTPSQAKDGICRSVEAAQSNITETAKKIIERESSFESTVVTQDDIAFTSSLQGSMPYLPDYLNVLYALSIVAAGLILLIGLWLLFKHRLAGIITIGVASIISALLLYFVTALLPNVAQRFANVVAANDILTASVASLGASLRHTALLLGVGGAITVALASIILVAITRRQKNHDTVHF